MYDYSIQIIFIMFFFILIANELTYVEWMYQYFPCFAMFRFFLSRGNVKKINDNNNVVQKVSDFYSYS